MSSVSLDQFRQDIKFREICIGNINKHTEPHRLLAHFEQFGKIVHYNYTSPTGGYVFITYEKSSMVDNCISARPHYLDNRHLYVKRALPIDDDHPRERYETSRDLMIVIHSDDEVYKQPEFLLELREYFSSYGRLYACKYCHEENFDYILVEFSDKDSIDKIILDKPHRYNDLELDQASSTIKDAIDDDNCHSIKSSKLNSSKKEPIKEVDLQNEVYRLQNVLKNMNEEFDIKRKKLEEDCCQELKQLNENTTNTQQLQQDLAQEHAQLLLKYESLKQENDILNEQYLSVELENFEITSYYEQILVEEKAKTAQLEAEYTKKLQESDTNHSLPCSSSSSSSTQSNRFNAN
ncbi:hypothetical protein I4U23_007249 [Adineta vaga]|nr:hypothetical protein I4U23_007249 [Adineta vaga]